MKSFLEFVSCCLAIPEVSTSKEEVAATATATVEEVPSRVEVAVTKKRRVRVGIPGSMSPAEWKPSLHMISEDRIVAEKRERPQPSPTSADRAVKKKSNTGSRSKVHVRSYSDYIGHNPVPAVIPTFSPTPFMF